VERSPGERNSVSFARTTVELGHGGNKPGVLVFGFDDDELDPVDGQEHSRMHRLD
jgi:hypothetical protein